MARLHASLTRRFADAFAPHPADNVWLDAVRTLAIVLVVLRHGQRVFAMGPELTFWEAFKINGWAGVDLFFILSGYLVTAGLLRTHARKGRIDLRGYAVRRIRRIVPAFVFVMLLVLVGYFPGHEVTSETLWQSVLLHLLFLHNLFDNGINVVFWSLGVEAKFYALIPLFVWAAVRVRRTSLLVLAGLVALAAGPLLRGAIHAEVQPQDYLSYLQDLRWPFYACIEPFVLGFMVALLEQRGWLRLRPDQAARLFVLTLVAVCVYLGRAEFLAEITLWDATMQPLILAVLFGVLVAAAVVMKPIPTRWAAPFRFGARVSYALYLVHFPLIPLSVSLAQGYGLGAWGFWAIYVGLSLVHAVAILVFVEKPLMGAPRRAAPGEGRGVVPLGST